MQLVQSNKAISEPSEVVSRYLEAIYYMWFEKEPLRSARLADWLGVSRPTVAVGLRRMARDGLVRMNGRKEIELTPSGMRSAESIVRRHRIMERWLTDSLVSMRWPISASHASTRRSSAIASCSDSPSRASGCGRRVSEKRLARLSSLAPGQGATITRVSEVAEREAPLLLAYLSQRDLTPGREVSVEETDVVGKTLRVRVAERDVTLSHETASKIWAVPARQS